MVYVVSVIIVLILQDIVKLYEMGIYSDGWKVCILCIKMYYVYYCYQAGFSQGLQYSCADDCVKELDVSVNVYDNSVLVCIV